MVKPKFEMTGRDLLEWMERCIREGGTPQIVEKMGARDFLKESMVLIRCWGAGEKVPGGVVKIVDPETLEIIKKYAPLKSSYKYILEELRKRYGYAVLHSV